ncbi:hypothetical protein N7G274_003927 [Stereocaulon virgatum]|uniref:HMG box domain-containing protein n=1 Tax=Stereocaulon virgatum TaxID=373712 RepID=A0ABR4AES9_9LECA
MIFQGGRAIGRLPQLSLPCLGGSRAALSSSSVERVATFYNVFQNQHIFELALKVSLITPVARRTYADDPVSRPKAHTGRTTAATRKAPTTSKTKAAKKPAPKTKAAKAVPKAKSNAKPRIKPKPKKTPAKKAKPKRKRKALTEAQKKSATIKSLKVAALEPPHGSSLTAWVVFWNEFLKDNTPVGEWRVGWVDTIRKAAAEFKNLSPERLEHYNHLANQSKVAKERAYRQWVESYTPEEIRKANHARQHLGRKQKKRIALLRDHRQVKRPRSNFVIFYMKRWASGDFKGLKITEAAEVARREWIGLSTSEKKLYEDSAKQDMYRYEQEVKTVYKRDLKHRVVAKAAA